MSSSHAKPRCAGQIARRVGSVTIAASARIPSPRARGCRCSRTLRRQRRRRSPRRRDSHPPRGAPPRTSPRRRLSCRTTRGRRGGRAHLGVPRRVHHAFHADGVEMAVEEHRMSAGAADARDHVRTVCMTVSWISTRKPQCSSVSASDRAQALSPGPSLTSDGFRESIATRFRVSAMASPRAGVTVINEIRWC